MTTSVALIGSSGGGTATLGHTDPLELLRVVRQELEKADASLDHVLFVALEGGKGMDMALPSDKSTLYSMKNHQIQVVESGPLEQVNVQLKNLDEKYLGPAIAGGKVQGLICISCSIELSAATLKAASEKQIPVTGSGGTSLSAASSKFGIRLVGNAGGSVATTTYTRAASYTHALAKTWKQSYLPFSKASRNQGPQWTSVLNSCLPAFWTLSLTKRFLLEFTPFGEGGEKQLVLNGVTQVALPIACSVIMASSHTPQYGSTVLMAASVAAAVGCSGSILAGLCAGWLVSKLCGRVLHGCVRLGVPATMTNLLVAGGVGSFVGMVVLPATPYLKQVTELVRTTIHWSMNGAQPGIGFVIGCLFCYGCKVGYYHLVGLPVILMEMEHGDASLWGSIDEATLVLISAGICAANLICPVRSDKFSDNSALCWRGMRINLLCGDFIEAAYPFMEKSWIVNLGGYLGSGLATEMLTGNSREALGLAYLPLPLSIWLAEDRKKVTIAYALAFGTAFVATLLSNSLTTWRKETKRNE